MKGLLEILQKVLDFAKGRDPKGVEPGEDDVITPPLSTLSDADYQAFWESLHTALRPGIDTEILRAQMASAITWKDLARLAFQGQRR